MRRSDLRLEEVPAVVAYGLDTAGIKGPVGHLEWWTAKNRYLKWKRPCKVWRRNPDLVLDAVTAFVNGDYV